MTKNSLGHDAAAALFSRGCSAAANFLLNYHIIFNLKDLQNVAKIGKLLATYISAYMYYYFSDDVVVFKFRYKLYLRIKTSQYPMISVHFIERNILFSQQLSLESINIIVGDWTAQHRQQSYFYR